MNFEKQLQVYQAEYPDAPGDIILATRLIVRTARMLEGQLNSVLTEMDIQIHEYLALMLIKLESGPLRPTELSETLGISRPQITRLLDQLEERGLIIRKHSAVDRRALMLSLSAKGKRQLDEASPVVHQAYRSSWECSTKQLPSLLRGLRGLYMTLREAEQIPATTAEKK